MENTPIKLTQKQEKYHENAARLAEESSRPFSYLNQAAKKREIEITPEDIMRLDAIRESKALDNLHKTDSEKSNEELKKIRLSLTEEYPANIEKEKESLGVNELVRIKEKYLEGVEQLIKSLGAVPSSELEKQVVAMDETMVNDALDAWVDAIDRKTEDNISDEKIKEYKTRLESTTGSKLLITRGPNLTKDRDCKNGIKLSGMINGEEISIIHILSPGDTYECYQKGKLLKIWETKELFDQYFPIAEEREKRARGIIDNRPHLEKNSN